MLNTKQNLKYETSRTMATNGFNKQLNFLSWCQNRTEQTQDAIPKTVKSTPSDPEGTDKHRDTAVSKQDEVPTSMEVDATATKRRLDDTVSVSGEHLPRRFEREWHGEKGKIGRYKAQPVSPTRQHKPTK